MTVKRVNGLRVKTPDVRRVQHRVAPVSDVAHSSGKKLQLTALCISKICDDAVALWQLDAYFQVLGSQERRGRKNTPTAVESIFGCILCGLTAQPSMSSEETALLTQMVDDVAQLLLRFWENDSSVTLSWIKGDLQRWKSIVANLVQQILNLTEPSHLEKLVGDQFWWNSPTWIRESEDQWPRTTAPLSPEERELTSLERKVMTVLITTARRPGLQKVIDPGKHSKMERLVRITAYCVRFVTNARSSRDGRKNGGSLSLCKWQEAEKRGIKEIHAEAFPENVIIQHDKFLSGNMDADGVIDNGSATLDEPVLKTILRDLKAVSSKLRAVIFPRSENQLIRDWDLWGPLFLCVFIAVMLHSNDGSGKEPRFTEAFAITWFGACIVTINIKLLGGTISVFQSLCILGYCLLPLSIAVSFCRILSLQESYSTTFIVFLRLFVVIVSLIWSCYASITFLYGTYPESRKALAVYPLCFFYIVIAWLILSYVH
ncbi:Protein YIPF6 [Trichinella spiralis]|uniref:Protein YIPF6 n=1 Tax=Trichinella spiralis TaxID=6334 RepID=A0A0V1BVA4_TRISP|nr:Protein YIPF6 [Trichinella spiralis]